MATVQVRVVKRPIGIDGKTYTEGQIAPMLEKDVARFVRAGLVVVAQDATESDSDASVSPSGDVKVWKLKTSPKEYLEKFPEGPHAELALSILALADDDVNETTQP